MRLGGPSRRTAAALAALAAAAAASLTFAALTPGGQPASEPLTVSVSSVRTPTDAAAADDRLIGLAAAAAAEGIQPEEAIVRGVSGDDVITPDDARMYDDLPSDIGGELVSAADGDIEQALPANVRLDRISIDIEVTKPLASARVSSVFGFRRNPVTGSYTFHKGLDLAAPGGTEIHAMYAGRVKISSRDKGYGNYILLDHGGFQTLYAHCSKLLCSCGDSVAAGDVIALVGSTGNSTGNHLHVEFRRDGQRYDPEWILGGIYS